MVQPFQRCLSHLGLNACLRSVHAQTHTHCKRIQEATSLRREWESLHSKHHDVTRQVSALPAWVCVLCAANLKTTVNDTCNNTGTKAFF